MQRTLTIDLTSLEEAYDVGRVKEHNATIVTVQHVDEVLNRELTSEEIAGYVAVLRNELGEVYCSEVLSSSETEEEISYIQFGIPQTWAKTEKATLVIECLISTDGELEYLAKTSEITLLFEPSISSDDAIQDDEIRGLLKVLVDLVAEYSESAHSVDVLVDSITEALAETDNLDVSAEQLSDGAQITITKKDGTSIGTRIYNGAKGDNGADGFSPVATVERNQANNGAVITVTDKNGTTIAPIKDGVGFSHPFYTPTGASVDVEDIPDGAYIAADDFMLVVAGGSGSGDSFPVNEGDVFYTETMTSAIYKRGYIFGDDLIFFIYPDSDTGVVSFAASELPNILNVMYSDIETKLDTNQGVENVGKAMVVNALGKLVPQTIGGGGTIYTAGQNISISAQNVISNIAPDLLKFVDTLPSTNIDEKAYYLTLAAKYYPTLDDFLTSSALSDYLLCYVTNSNGAWRCMRAKSRDIFAHTGNFLPSSVEYVIYGIDENNEWEQIYSGTNTDWATYMGVPNGKTVDNIYYSNVDLRNAMHNVVYAVSNNRTDKDGYLVDITEANPFMWTVNQYVNNAWVERGVSDFEELFNTVNSKVLADYATITAMNTALALKADTATTYTKTEVDTALSNKVSSSSVSTIWTGTQAEYDAIVTKDSNTLYFIVEASNGV